MHIYRIQTQTTKNVYAIYRIQTQTPKKLYAHTHDSKSNTKERIYTYT